MYKVTQSHTENLQILKRCVLQGYLKVKDGTGRHYLKIILQAVFGLFAITINGYPVAYLNDAAPFLLRHIEITDINARSGKRRTKQLTRIAKTCNCPFEDIRFLT